MTTTLTFHDNGTLLSESYAGGTLAGLSVNNSLDSLLRRSQVQPKNGASVLGTATFGYDNASRLSSVSDGTYSASYTYLANSPLVSQISFKQSSTVRMTTTKQYDNLNRLWSISTAPAGTPAPAPLAYNYVYNDGNQRVRVNQADGSYW